jgi:hypothetical protein
VQRGGSRLFYFMLGSQSVKLSRGRGIGLEGDGRGRGGDGRRESGLDGRLEGGNKRLVGGYERHGRHVDGSRGGLESGGVLGKDGHGRHRRRILEDRAVCRQRQRRDRLGIDGVDVEAVDGGDWDRPRIV